MKIKKNLILTGIIVSLIVTPITYVLGVNAEQSGITPDSGSVSRIKELYDKLVLDNKGSDEAGSWGDWGSMWNRIYSAADNSVDYELQALVEYDDYEGPGGSGDAAEDYMGEEAVWTNTLPLTDGKEVWKDERTGLYWSHNLGSYTNIFPNQDHSACPFFNGSTEEEKLQAKYRYDGLTPACGDSINVCGALVLDADGDGIDETTWYLPTEKEMQQAYIDGIFNQTTSAFTTPLFFKTSSERSDEPSYNLLVRLHSGSTTFSLKTSTSYIHCVAWLSML